MGLYSPEKEDGKEVFFFAGLSLIVFFVLSFVKYMLTNYAIQRGNKFTYFKMVDALTKCPSSYFDKTPSGRILNRFTSDMGEIDGYLHFIVIDSIEGPLYFLNLLLTIIVFNYWLIIPSLIQIVILYKFYVFMNPIMLLIKKIDCLNRAPV